MIETDLTRLVARYHVPPPDAAWKQINVALTRADGDAIPSARALFAALAPSLADWRREALIHGWFFMRKPPDVRLRMCLSGIESELENVFDAALDGLLAAGRIQRWFWSRYEPEQERFGGASAMAHVHAHFHCDSASWLVLDALDERSARAVPPDLLLPAVLHHLFGCCCGVDGTREAWRVLAGLIGAPASAEALDTGQMPATLDALASDAGLDPRERNALQALCASNERLGDGLHALGGAWAAEHRMAQVAATVGLFGLNRHGFAGQRSGPMAARVVAALDERSA